MEEALAWSMSIVPTLFVIGVRRVVALEKSTASGWLELLGDILGSLVTVHTPETRSE